MLRTWMPLAIVAFCACSDDLSSAISDWKRSQQTINATLARLKKRVPEVQALAEASAASNEADFERRHAAQREFEKGIEDLEEQFLAHQVAVEEAMQSGKRVKANAAIAKAFKESEAAAAHLDQVVAGMGGRKKAKAFWPHLRDDVY